MSIAYALARISQADSVKSLEREACDLGVRARSPGPSDRIAVLAVDDSSIARVGGSA